MCLFSVIINARKASKILYGKPEGDIIDWITQFTSTYAKKIIYQDILKI